MTIASLHDYSSLVREIEGECAFVRVSGDFLVSGSRSGEVACWNISNGSEIWRLGFEGPCSNADSNEDYIFFTESDRIHAILLKSGEESWSAVLEGSSDLVCVSSNCIWVTSSVYNFEIQDYSEGSIWQIDYSGEVRNRWSTMGRAWSLSDVQGKALMGLSRPRCGYAIASEREGIEYLELEEKHPVTVGCKLLDGGVVLGHSNGSVTEIHEDGFSTFSAGNSAVRSIDCQNGWVVGLESGGVASSEAFDSWSIDSYDTIDVVCFGPSLNDKEGIWYSYWKNKGVVCLVDHNIGSVQIELSHDSRIVSCFGMDNVICIGDEDGCIHVIEREVLRRRFERPPERNLDSGRGSELRKKIRALRDG